MHHHELESQPTMRVTLTNRPSAGRRSTRQNIMRRFLLPFLLATGATVTTATAQPESNGFISPALDTLASAAIKEVITQDYEAAMLHVREMERRFPDSPAGAFFHAAVLHSIMLDYEDYRREKEFKRAVEHTITKSRKLLRRNPESAWGNFFLGGGLGYLAFYYGKRAQYVQAFRTGMESIAALERALAADSTLYDAYLGIGTYKYYRSKYARFLTWLPFVRDERAEGIRMVRLAAERGTYSRYPAINSLAWILVSEKRLPEANRLAHQALAAYPTSRFFMWTAAATDRLLGRWQAALKLYKSLLLSFTNEGRLGSYNALVLRTRMAECYLRLGKLAEADAQKKLALAIPLSKEEKRRARKYLQKLSKIATTKSATGLTTTSSEDPPNPK